MYWFLYAAQTFYDLTAASSFPDYRMLAPGCASLVFQSREVLSELGLVLMATGGALVNAGLRLVLMIFVGSLSKHCTCIGKPFSSCESVRRISSRASNFGDVAQMFNHMNTLAIGRLLRTLRDEWQVA